MKEEEKIFAVPSVNRYCVDGVNLCKKESIFNNLKNENQPQADPSVWLGIKLMGSIWL